MSTSYSPSRSSASLRLQSGFGAGMSRLRSSSLKQPPEPLRRAVADCLSSSSSSSSPSSSASSSPLPSYNGNPSALASEASRTLRDYLATQATTDLAYSVLLEHTLAERERSPAVVARCVALLKRYLLRYKPSEDTLQLIDRFCVNIIVECDVSLNRKSSSWSQSFSSKSAVSTSANVPPLPVSSFASAALVKSLHYVRSLIAQNAPKRSFQPAAFAGASSVSRQALPTLSSLLSRSFNSQLCPANGRDSLESKEASTVSVCNAPIAEKVEGVEDHEFLAVDVFKWRWNGYEQTSLLSPESDHLNQDVSRHNFLEVGAAALLVGDMEAKMKGESWRIFGTKDMPFLDQRLQPSLLITVTNSAAARAHLRAITASKRSKPNSDQIWEDSPVSTFRPRARPLFQYRHYSEQQPLRLNPAEVCEVIAAVCSETAPTNTNLMTVSAKLSNASGNPSMDVAASVLIKLVIDMYVVDSITAAPLTLSMLEEMLRSPQLGSKSRAFDLIINLGVHAHLLEPIAPDDASAIEEVYSQEPYMSNETHLSTQGKKETNPIKKFTNSSAINDFESWLLGILFELLLHLVQVEEKEESVWASALSCLLYFVCDRGKVQRSRLKGLDIRVIKMLIQVSRRNSWAEVVHRKLIGMLTNLFYQVSDDPVNDFSTTPIFLFEQVDLLGGIEFIFMELVLSSSREERINLYLVLFDYVLHQINENCMLSNMSEYSDEEIRPIAALLTLADAPEALHISVKLGVEGIEELLRRSISAALSRYSNSDRLNTLLGNIIEKFNKLLRSFTHLDKEFSEMIQISKSFKSLNSMEDGVLSNSLSMKMKLSWATLHSLLHSKRMAYRQNGYVWLGDLLMAEISEERSRSMCSNIGVLRQKIILAATNEYSDSLDVSLPVWLMCGLLKSKNNLIRWGFLFVLERLLMRCKFLLDESELQSSGSGGTFGCSNESSRLEKANSVVDIMSSALYLVTQINETDRMNILKMCDILFSQLCLKVLSETANPVDGVRHDSRSYSSSDWNNKVDAPERLPQKDHYFDEESMEGTKSKLDNNNDILICETASMAALLLRGRAIVPMELVARVPFDVFYWPLIQLAGAATDNIALGVSVGSKGRGNVPGATSDIRATLLLLLIGKCTVDPAAFREVGGEDFFRELLLDDRDARVVYYSSTFLLKRMMTEERDRYQRLLHSLIARAQQSNNEKLLENPYLQMRGLLQLSNE